MKIISACLVGVNCKYNGGNNLEYLPLEIYKEFKEGKLIPICPEQLGGLTTPRKASQIQNSAGEEVLAGKAKVKTKDEEDVSKNFIKGAQEVKEIVQKLGIKEAILKQRSPSCGCGEIYDGTFSKTVRKGDGVTSALLKKIGVKIYSEEDFK